MMHQQQEGRTMTLRKKSSTESGGEKDDEVEIPSRANESLQIEWKDVGVTAKEAENRAAMKTECLTVSVEEPTHPSSELSRVVGIPEEHIRERYVRIFQPSRNVMQAGIEGTGRRWRIEFETRERWENPLMGWTSSGDPLSSIDIPDFSTKEDAIVFVKKNGWDYFVQEPSAKKPIRPKSYGENFTWNKRTKISTK